LIALERLAKRSIMLIVDFAQIASHVGVHLNGVNVVLIIRMQTESQRGDDGGQFSTLKSLIAP